MQKEYATKTIFSFFGPPGSGKGTLARYCFRELGFQVLSTGDLCRKHVALGSGLGRTIEESLKSSKLIPDDLISDAVIDWIILNSKTANPMILDGYPRTRGQVESFFKFFKKFIPDYKFRVMCFILSNENIVKRLKNRLVCENKNCQVTFSNVLSNMEQKHCQFCGSRLIIRDEDEGIYLEKRLARFPRHKNAVLGYYCLIGQEVEEINIEDKNIEEVFRYFKDNIIA